MSPVLPITDDTRRPLGRMAGARSAWRVRGLALRLIEIFRKFRDKLPFLQLFLHI
jgi:hypothetical protein